MFIKLTNKTTVDPDERLRIRAEVLAWLETSRFTATVTLLHHYRWKHVIKIENIRLRQAKTYCGQHPNECAVSPFFQKKHRRDRWLEGADFVGFNDGLNDLLDRLRRRRRCLVLQSRGCQASQRRDLQKRPVLHPPGKVSAHRLHLIQGDHRHRPGLLLLGPGRPVR